MLDELIAAWKTGAGTRRIGWLAFWGERAAGYADARALGVADEDLVAAVGRGVWLRDYVAARRESSHLEVLEAHAATGDVFAYACERRAGHGHAEAIEVVLGGDRYVDPRPGAEVAPEPRESVTAEPMRLGPLPPRVEIGVRAGR